MNKNIADEFLLIVIYYGKKWTAMPGLDTELSVYVYD
jgi:hypothetical protein